MSIESINKRMKKPRQDLINKAVKEIITNFEYDKEPLDLTRDECELISVRLYALTASYRRMMAKL